MIRALVAFLFVFCTVGISTTEYQVVLRRGIYAAASQQEEFLNEQARDGWQLIAIIPSGTEDVIIYLGREDIQHGHK